MPRLRTVALLTVALAGVIASSAIAAPAFAWYNDQAIEGTVQVTGYSGPLGGTVNVHFVGTPNDPDTEGAAGTINPDGSYHIGLYEPGTYQVCVVPDSHNWEPACWADGGNIVVGAGQTVTGKDIQSSQYGGIGGGLLVDSGSGAHSDSSAAAHLYRYDDPDWVYVDTIAAWSGNYRFDSIVPGQYSLEFVHSSGTFNREYWQDAAYWADRDVVTVSPGATTTLGTTVLEPRNYEVTRVQGPDRFATSVAISKERYADGEQVPVVYIASGVNYPDALAAGPAAAHLGGTLMIVQPNAIPPVVAAELSRIDPQRIVVVGATAAISQSVASQLTAFVDDPSDVTRIGGADRFETSRKIVLDAWGDDGSQAAFFATGYNFPDALAAVPAAARWDAPIILVPGTAGSLDSATRSLMTHLGVQTAHIIGAEGAVSSGIQAGIESIVGDQWIRYAGVNRFATAVLISIVNFDVADRAYLATGYNFADALAAGPSAAAEGAPIYLTNGTCVYDIVMSDIEGVGANGVVVLGATGAQGTGVSNLSVCASGLASGQIATGEISGPGFAEGELRLPEGVIDPRG